MRIIVVICRAIFWFNIFKYVEIIYSSLKYLAFLISILPKFLQYPPFENFLNNLIFLNYFQQQKIPVYHFKGDRFERIFSKEIYLSSDRIFQMIFQYDIGLPNEQNARKGVWVC